jgi:DHA1 family multidrug resistance protein-like MFS transporter
LTVIVAVQWMGATLGLPLLPLFLYHRGGSPSVVGVVVSAFFVAGLATQFVVGHLVDRFGRRRLLVAGLLAYAVASATFVLPISAPWFALSRAVQGIGAGAIEVASLSAISGLFPEAERGRAISRIIAAQLGGIALGPLIGSLVPLRQLGWAFVATGVASTIASLRALRSDLGDAVIHSEPLGKVHRSRQLYGALTVALATGLCVGVYESTWSLLMQRYGASTFQIRLSWTLFCLPWVFLSGVGGWLADHGNRKFIAGAGLCSALSFLAIYPHVHNVVILLMLGPLESVGAALSVPSTSSLLSQGALPREMGRRQGMSASANTAALAGSSLVGGALFTVSPSLPYSVMAILAALCAASLIFWWRDVVGHVAKGPTAP